MIELTAGPGGYPVGQSAPKGQDPEWKRAPGRRRRQGLVFHVDRVAGHPDGLEVLEPVLVQQPGQPVGPDLVLAQVEDLQPLGEWGLVQVSDPGVGHLAGAVGGMVGIQVGQGPQVLGPGQGLEPPVPEGLAAQVQDPQVAQVRAPEQVSDFPGDGPTGAPGLLGVGDGR